MFSKKLFLTFSELNDAKSILWLISVSLYGNLALLALKKVTSVISVLSRSPSQLALRQKWVIGKSRFFCVVLVRVKGKFHVVQVHRTRGCHNRSEMGDGCQLCTYQNWQESNWHAQKVETLHKGTSLSRALRALHDNWRSDLPQLPQLAPSCGIVAPSLPWILSVSCASTRFFVASSNYTNPTSFFSVATYFTTTPISYNLLPFL